MTEIEITGHRRMLNTNRKCVDLLQIARLLLSTVAVCFSAISWGQVEEQRSSTQDLGQAMGFLIGQQYTLDRIKKTYADLAPLVRQAELEFDASFEAAEVGMHADLKSGAKDGYAALVAESRRRIHAELAIHPISREDAVAFIEEVRDRAKGRIAERPLKTLLHYRFRDRPAEEFERGFTTVYRTKGHPKAKGTDFQVRIPMSWRAKEGERPNVIQLFRSESGRGAAMCLLMANAMDLPRGTRLTKQDIDETFSQSGLREIAAGYGTFVSGKSIVIDRHPGGMVIVDVTQQRLDQVLSGRSVMYMALQRENILSLQCMTFADNGVEAAKVFSRHEATFRLSANSFVIQDQYK